ncbi:MAG: hypothetical protein AAB794_01455 [Patescibacteria group bacterium]
MRRYLLIAAVVILLLGVGVIIYFLFLAKKPVVTTTPGVGLPIAGQGTSQTGIPEGGGTIVSPNTPTTVSPRLVRISVGPVALGESVVSKTVSTSSTPETTVNYIDRESGNIFSYSTASRATTRTSNKTIPGIQSASWLPNASLAFVRYLSGDNSSTINTYALPLSGSGGFFLSQNLADIAVSSTSVLILASGVNGSIGSLTNVDGSHATQIFTTPLSAIHASFAGKNQYLVYTKPSSLLLGNAYLVDSAGIFSRIFGPRMGLTALASPSGKWVLVSYSLNGSMQMGLVNTTTNEVLSLPISTITDKCVWSADDSVIYCGVPLEFPFGSYPDDWYQGAVHFSDRIWKVQVSGRYAQLVLDFTKETNTLLDAESLVVDQLNSTLVFVNKNDLSLWSYSL